MKKRKPGRPKKVNVKVNGFGVDQFTAMFKKVKRMNKKEALAVAGVTTGLALAVIAGINMKKRGITLNSVMKEARKHLKEQQG